jgi:hypothetical protein
VLVRAQPVSYDHRVPAKWATSPITVTGRLIAGPRGQATARAAWLSPLYPLAWLAFTLIRGAVINWYPYPFIDVTKLATPRPC